MAACIQRIDRLLLQDCVRAADALGIHRQCRIRYRKNIACRQSYSTQVDALPSYPAVKPQFPPGTWGNMSSRTAWKWYTKAKSVVDVPSIPERLLSIESTVPKTRYKVLPFSSQPKLLSYQQYITKTYLLHELPSIYKDVPAGVDIGSLQNIIQDVILDERLKLKRNKPAGSNSSSDESKLLLTAIMSAVASKLASVAPYLCQEQVDLDVPVVSCWYRRGLKPISCRGQSKDVDSDCIRYMYTGHSDYQLRSETPLADILPLADDMCKGSYPLFNFSPVTIGQFADLTNENHVPGFLYGDPCQFTTVSLLLSNPIQHLRASRGEAFYHDAMLGAGVVAAFGVLSAEAYYEGLTQYENLPHPLTTQVVVTDGKEFSFFVYQLNTLRLYVDDEANPFRNLCWTSGGALKLYEDVTDDKVVGFNVDVLSKLVSFMMHERKSNSLVPRTLPTDGQLFPFRPRYERWTDIPVMKEGSVNIPTYVKYRKGTRSDGRPHGSKKSILDPMTGKTIIL